VNPNALAGAAPGAWPHVLERLRRSAVVGGTLDTRADGETVGRVAALLAETRPDVVVAAGGDGTLGAVVEAVVGSAVPRRPAVGIIPLGTANNVARALGLPSVRQGGAGALATALDVVLAGRERALDLGQVGGRTFVGSLAIGMDADILAFRNRLRARLGLGRRLGGYPLYLWSCAVNLLVRGHGARARLLLDGVERHAYVYDVLLLNTPLYAGEFRFDAAEGGGDGRLDLHLFGGPRDYVRGFVSAWRRHVHHERGDVVAPPPGLARVSELVIELATPVAAQIDGEEHPPAARYHVRTLPRALTVRVPAR
jgi:diacylglycerol kinase family enzyme